MRFPLLSILHGPFLAHVNIICLKRGITVIAYFFICSSWGRGLLQRWKLWWCTFRFRYWCVGLYWWCRILSNGMSGDRGVSCLDIWWGIPKMLQTIRTCSNGYMYHLHPWAQILRRNTNASKLYIMFLRPTWIC